jgi:hypothetical protein
MRPDGLWIGSPRPRGPVVGVVVSILNDAEVSRCTERRIFNHSGGESKGRSFKDLDALRDLVDGFLYDVLGAVCQSDDGIWRLLDPFDQIRIDTKALTAMEAREQDHRFAPVTD